MMKQKHNFINYVWIFPNMYVSTKTFQEQDKAPEVTISLILISSFK